MDTLSLKLDGKQAAAKTFTRKRAVLYNALDYAVEVKALGANNLGGGEMDGAEDGASYRQTGRDQCPAG